MKLTAKAILDMINNDVEHEAFGLRADRAGIEIGQALDNSHQWFQDWQEWWGKFPADDYNADPYHPYNDEMGCWDDGELDGVCTLGITPDMTVDDVENVLSEIEGYRNGCHTEIYLIGGSYGQSGNDIGEQIVSEAVRLA